MLKNWLRQGYLPGSYIPGESLIHKIKAEIKLICISLIFISLLITANFVIYLVFFILLLVAFQYSDLSLNLIKKDLKLAFWMLTAALLFHIKIFIEAWKAENWSDFINLLWQGLTPVSMIFLMMLASTLLSRTTSPIELSQGISTILNPLKKFKAPVQDLNLMLLTTFNFLPVLYREAQKVYQAQRMRGFWAEQNNHLQNIKLLHAFFIPVLNHTLKCSKELADNWILRGYKPDCRKSSKRIKNLTKKDIFPLILVFIIFLSAILLK